MRFFSVSLVVAVLVFFTGCANLLSQLTRADVMDNLHQLGIKCDIPDPNSSGAPGYGKLLMVKQRIGGGVVQFAVFDPSDPNWKNVTPETEFRFACGKYEWALSCDWNKATNYCELLRKYEVIQSGPVPLLGGAASVVNALPSIGEPVKQPVPVVEALAPVKETVPVKENTPPASP